MQLLGLVGSLRAGSYNRALLRAIGGCLPAGVTLTEFERLGEIPLFDPEVELDEVPDAVTALKQAIAAADGLVIVSPEYNYSLPGFLKNAIDWASRPPATSPLRDKPVGLASASIGMSGGMRAQYHLRQILVYTDTPAMAQPEVIIPHVRDRFDDRGVLVDMSTRDLLVRFGARLVSWVQRFPKP